MNFLKTSLTFAMALAAGGLSAESLAPGTFGTQEANLFECVGSGDVVKATYSSTSLTGQPQLSIETHFRDMGLESEISVMGEQILNEHSPMGRLISAHAGYVPDMASYRYTLVLPQVNVDVRPATSVTFDTVLVMSTSRTTFAGPAMVRGPLVDSQYFPVSCTAKYVTF